MLRWEARCRIPRDLFDAAANVVGAASVNDGNDDPDDNGDEDDARGQYLFLTSSGTLASHR